MSSGPSRFTSQRRVEARAPAARVRGLVFGAYMEASADVYDLITYAAGRIAARQWQLAGARSEDEMRNLVREIDTLEDSVATLRSMQADRKASDTRWLEGMMRSVQQALIERAHSRAHSRVAAAATSHRWADVRRSKRTSPSPR